MNAFLGIFCLAQMSLSRAPFFGISITKHTLLLTCNLVPLPSPSVEISVSFFELLLDFAGFLSIPARIRRWGIIPPWPVLNVLFMHPFDPKYLLLFGHCPC